MSSRERPGTKPVSTEAGETHKKRTAGPHTRASDSVMVSSAALAAQKALLLPEPVKADMEEADAATPPCDDGGFALQGQGGRG